VQWTGSAAQREASTRVAGLSQAVYAAWQNAIGVGSDDPQVYCLLQEAEWRILRAQTSCNVFWGEAWVQRCHDDLDAASWFLGEAGRRFS
jgi:hypothetical protein